MVEPRTHTMSLGTLRAALVECAAAADEIVWFQGANIRWDVTEIAQASPKPATVETNLERLLENIVAEAGEARRTHVVLMSNGAFGGIHEKLRRRLVP